MDLQNCVISLYAIVLTCLIASGIVYGQWEDDEIPDDGSELIQMMPLDQPIKIQDLLYPQVPAEPEAEVDNFETNDADSALINVLKRGGMFLSDGYRRLPRIKQRKIIPFYSYGNDYRGYRSRPRYVSRTRNPYAYSPWKARVYNSGNRFLRGPSVYGSY